MFRYYGMKKSEITAIIYSHELYKYKFIRLTSFTKTYLNSFMYSSFTITDVFSSSILIKVDNFFATNRAHTVNYGILIKYKISYFLQTKCSTWDSFPWPKKKQKVFENSSVAAKVIVIEDWLISFLSLSLV